MLPATFVKQIPALSNEIQRDSETVLNHLLEFQMPLGYNKMAANHYLDS